MYNPHTTRYSFGKYHFCPSCVTGASPLDSMSFDTTLTIGILAPSAEEVYNDAYIKQFQGKPEIPLWVGNGNLGITAVFDDKTFFVLNPTQEAFKMGWNPPYHIIVPSLEDKSLQNLEPTKHQGFFLRMHRWDLKPFNIKTVILD